MKLTERRTHNFREMKVDGVETTLFKSDKKQMQVMIANLIHVADCLMDYTEENFNDYVNLR